ncbi:hypothetical protein DFH09DRAFT_1336733 [Mycena vulgaris]|nr:hypothetical protein DFH09DRAFT_1336733 [Mycena vulgaris]
MNASDVGLTEKKFDEITPWEWGDQYLHVEVTTLNPLFFYGLFPPHLTISAPDFGALSSDLMFYKYLFKDDVFPSLTLYIDVHDFAQALVRRC